MNLRESMQIYCILTAENFVHMQEIILLGKSGVVDMMKMRDVGCEV